MTFASRVLVRCSSDPACSSLPASTPSAIRPITVTCPGGGSPVTGYFGDIGFNSKTQIAWANSQIYMRCEAT